MADTLSEAEIDHFIKEGYCYVRSAFSNEVAAKCRTALWDLLGKQHGIYEDSSESYKRAEKGRISISEHFKGSDLGAPWDQVWSPRLRRAIDQLCGPEWVEPEGCGWGGVTFPDFAEEPWGAEGAWHVDGHGYTHCVDSKELGLVPIFLFSDIDPHEGGTALAPRSHLKTTGLLCEKALPGPAVSAKLRDIVDLSNIVETQGHAGDVLLLHPFLLHARSKNLSKKRVRFMCHPGLRLSSTMRIRVPPADPTPVERAILDAINSNESYQFKLLLGFDPDKTFGSSHRRRRRDDDDPTAASQKKSKKLVASTT